MKKAFTLIEITIAIALLAMMTTFTGLIFKVSIGTYRTAGANTEIMQKLRAITDQLNSDFKGLGKDGYLILYSEVINRKEYHDDIAQQNFRADRLYYFSTGDFQSWFHPYKKSNIARIYFGHDSYALNPGLNKPVNTWNLARDVELVSAALKPDSDPNSYAYFKADAVLTTAEALSILQTGVLIDIPADSNSIRRLMCQNVGELKIKWTDGTLDPNNAALAWFGLGNDNPQNAYDNVEPAQATPEKRYDAIWKPAIHQRFWPKAIKFTFTLYDSKGILKTGRKFTHIVYIGD